MKAGCNALFLLLFMLSVMPAAAAEKIDGYKICYGSHEAVTPVVKTGREWWMPRHQAILDRIQQEGDSIEMLFIGDSITHAWETRGLEVWNQYYAERNAMNLGFSGDRTQHVLWRLQNGEIDGISPQLAVVLIGTNNITDNTLSNMQIADGVVAICKVLRAKLPQTKILLLGIFPRDEMPTETRAKVDAVNKIIATVADRKWITYLNLKDVFVDAEQRISIELMDDFLHPTELGYQRWAAAMEDAIEKLWSPR